MLGALSPGNQNFISEIKGTVSITLTQLVKTQLWFLLGFLLLLPGKTMTNARS